MLIVFGGLPATGKTTLSIEIAKRLGATHLRVDTIEQALRREGIEEVEGIGYAIAYRVAADNLANGLSLVADSVNPLKLTRDQWKRIGEAAGAPVREVEILCSDAIEHRRRVETRTSDIEDLDLPTWQQVVSREYEPWERERITVDTAGRTADESLRELCERLAIPFR